jgi:CheY-like chemotaxis protein
MPRLVLIVEDSEDCGETLQIALESIPDLETRVYGNPDDAFAAAVKASRSDASPVAAVVTDLHLQAFNGFDLIRRLRAEPRFAGLPVIMISGDTDPKLPERALAQGADAFFAKPYSPSAVRRKLEQLL